MQHNDRKQAAGTPAPHARPLRERIGIYIQAQDSAGAITKIREADRAGVGQAWLAGGAAGFADPLSVLAAAATQTKTITLGTAIVPAATRHPIVTAQQALAIYDLAPDRLRLGLGPGNPLMLEHSYGLPQRAPLRYLREYLEIVRGLLWQGSIKHTGEFFQVSDSLPRSAPAPLPISALGLKSFQLAGEIADGAISALCPVPYLLNQALPALRAGAEERARPAPPIIASLPIALSSDAEAVSANVRQLIQVLVQSDAHARMFAQAGWASAVQGDPTALNALAQELTISGDAAAVQERLRGLLASGLDELLLIAMPIADAAAEWQQLLDLIGAL